MKYFYRYKGIITLLLVSFFFKDFFVPYYKKYIVEPFLEKFNHSIITDIIFSIIVLFILYWIIQKIKIKFYLKNESIVYSFISIIIYTIIRIIYAEQLLETKTFNFIKYSDILYVFALIPITVKIGFSYRTNGLSHKKQEIFDDNPLKNPDNDILNRRSKVNQVKRLIVGNHSKNSLALGIVGDWGSGKTSFMNFIESSFEKDDKYIIVHFNSWLNISINSIIQDFFNTVQKEVAKYSIDISKEIKTYGNNVLSINKNSVTETLLNTINILPKSSLSENFNNLNELLNKLDKKIIVFFDDLDRLQPNEVFEVLKLIRNTASFDIFNYIVGYDKKYLNEALKQNGIPFPDKYCEKIFLKEFPLPPIKQHLINKFIQDNISLFVPEKREELETFFEYADIFIYYYDGNLFESINNIRNAKRFLNELKISIDKVKNDVFLRDFILIKLLKFSYYEVYSLLFNKNTYLEYESTHKIYRLKKNKQKDSSFSSFGNSFENSFLKENIISLAIFNDDELKNIGAICNRIFSDSDNINSISYGENYYRYFEDEISESEVSNAEFNTFIVSSFEDKKKIIDNAHKKNKLGGFLLFIYKVNVHKDFTTKSQYEDFIKILFYIANLPPMNNYTYYLGIDFDFLNKCMNNRKDLLVQKFGYTNEENLKIFYKTLFYEKKKIYYFETDFVKFLYDRNGYMSTFSTPLSKEEIDDYLVFCFNNDSKLIKGIDNNFWHCYRLCFIKDWKSSGENSWNSTIKIIEANKEKLLFEIIPKYYKDFLLYCVVPQDWYGEDENSLKVGLSKEVILDLFGSYKGFIEYLESEQFNSKITEPIEFLDEFLIFAKEIEKTQKFINFDFHYKPVNQKLENIKNRRS